MSTCAQRASAAAAIVDRHAPNGRRLHVRFWDGSVLPSIDGTGPTVAVRSPRALAFAVRAPGQLGLARAWVSGDVEVVEGTIEDVLALRRNFEHVSLDTRERLTLLRVARSLGALRTRAEPPAIEVRPRWRHSLSSDRDAIRHHYDCSNEFYRLLLGPSLVYSCAYFADPADSLEVAQERKLEVICRKLRLQPGERLLDIGCGWGSLLLHAASHHGVRAVGITLSQAQADLARERIRDAGLSDRCEVRIADYREVSDGQYDKIASVGMVEHVGTEQLGEYARRVRALLRPGGLLLNHGIVRNRDQGPRPADFTARYVFPDGELQRVNVVLRALEEAGLEIRDVESLREHYGMTLRRWSANLARHADAAVGHVGEQRERVWRLYVAGAAAAFEDGDLSIIQTLAVAPGRDHGLPLARAGVDTPSRPRAATPAP